MSRRRVVVTGMGVVSPLGNSVAETWQGILAGKSGIAEIDRFSTEGFSARIGGAVKGLVIEDYLPAKDARKIDVFQHYGLVAGIHAVRDAGLEDYSGDLARIGVAIGSGIGGLEFIENTHKTFLESGPRRVSPFFVPGSVINMVAGNLAIRFGFQGPNFAITSACTTGTHNIGYAARTIAYGDADIMVAGGAEMATSPTSIASFANARALSTRNDEPTRASRPFDRHRDGFVLSDGAGVLVLEELESAKRRGARIYAELVGFGMSDDAYHITSPPEDGRGANAAMRNALNDAGLNVADVHYINAHGTSTPLGDVAETRAIKALFGDHAQRLAVSSTKSMTGHLLGAAGAIEAVFSVLSIVDNVLPPTINLDEPDEACDLDYVAHQAREQRVDVSMSNSFGFGGTNGTLVFRRYY